MTAREAFAKSKRILEGAGVPEPEAKARSIVSHALGISLLGVFTDIALSDEQLEDIERMTLRCAQGEPVEYVTGKAYFRYLELEVNPCVLIPRKETELVAQMAIELIRKRGYTCALDMCTGSGCIAVSMATEAGISVTASDISESALAVAKRNAELNGALQSICFLHSDMFDKLKGAYDIIVCNPPYVSDEEYAVLDKGVLFEPEIALKAGDGLEFYRRIAKDATRFINRGGSLVLEIGASQAKDVVRLLEQGGFTGIECLKDYAGRDRIVAARKE
jgi:release factor glutamine methyltransferase